MTSGYPAPVTAGAPPPISPTDPFELAGEAAAVVARATGVLHHDVAVVLGSGWAAAADALGPASADLAVTELPGFLTPAAAGHAGRVRSVPIGDKRALVFLGRTHLYEGHGPAATVHAVRVAAAAGARLLVLTNACGGLRPEHSPGRPVLIRDHLNLTATSPLVGADFVDLTAVYSPRLRALATQIDPGLTDGVYAQLPGPHYETPAEIAMLRTLGADLVGMSTALEAIAARAADIEVLGIGMVTNLAAGMTGAPLDHAEVLAVGRTSALDIGELLAQVVAQA